MSEQSKKSSAKFNSLAARVSELVWSRSPSLFYRTVPTSLPFQPRGVQLEITTKCNLNCIMCPNRGFKGFKMADMSLEIFKKAIEQSRPELEYVYLWGVGEPLTNPNFLKMVEAAKELGMKVSFSTNGTFIDEKMARKIVELQVDEIVFSVDSADPEMFEKIRRHAKYDKVIGNLERLLAIKKEKGSKVPSVSMTCTLLKMNISGAPDLINLAHRLGIEKVWFQNVISWDKFTTEQSILSMRGSEKVRQAFEETRRVAKEKGIFVRLPELEVSGRSVCRFPWFGPMNVRWDGSVTLCPWIAYPIGMHYILHEGKVGKKQVEFAPWVMGNINQTPLKEIWNNEKYRLIRSQFKEKKQPYPCNMCLHQYQVIC